MITLPASLLPSTHVKAGHLVGASNSPRMRPPFQPASARGLSRHEVSLTADIGVRTLAFGSVCLPGRPEPRNGSGQKFLPRTLHARQSLPACVADMNEAILLHACAPAPFDEQESTTWTAQSYRRRVQISQQRAA